MLSRSAFQFIVDKQPALPFASVRKLAVPRCLPALSLGATSCNCLPFPKREERYFQVLLVCGLRECHMRTRKDCIFLTNSFVCSCPLSFLLENYGQHRVPHGFRLKVECNCRTAAALVMSLGASFNNSSPERQVEIFHLQLLSDVLKNFAKHWSIYGPTDGKGISLQLR